METDLSKGKTKTLEAEGVSVSPVFGRPSITGGGDIIGRDIITIIDNVAKASPNDVQAIAANQIGLLLTYHEIVLAQSRRSFAWALIGAGMGLAFFMAAAGYIMDWESGRGYHPGCFRGRGRGRRWDRVLPLRQDHIADGRFLQPT